MPSLSTEAYATRVSFVLVAFLALGMFVAGCSQRSVEPEPRDARDDVSGIDRSNMDAGDASDFSDGSRDRSDGPHESTPACPTDPFFACPFGVPGQCSDTGLTPTCELGQWTCPAGTVPNALCSAPGDEEE